eukprot:897849-Pyramimonas_sp.AAC.1
MRGPTEAHAWRHSRVTRDISAPSHVCHWPASVSKTAHAAESSTILPPPRAPPFTWRRAPTNTAACCA